ncbi:PREDICTED: FAST kinase domain-containing protein 5-like isoform X2 [Priapulus caudatus]|uniref:FAST kinase domain-containing protein 5-like isoform X2 n=1 Tax=Priapulus caudatus TaxID=37621 RepID=A0ABM1DZJ9_PRICU|nr:PREDICTED: FAST kinase domain-containing protein 5-like isoform X2 [Priapulus caudatus]
MLATIKLMRPSWIRPKFRHSCFSSRLYTVSYEKAIRSPVGKRIPQTPANTYAKQIRFGEKAYGDLRENVRYACHIYREKVDKLPASESHRVIENILSDIKLHKKKIIATEFTEVLQVLATCDNNVLKRYCNDDGFKDLWMLGAEVSNTLSDDQLKIVLRSLTKIYMLWSASITDVLMGLDHCCAQRCRDWNTTTLLLVADIWHLMAVKPIQYMQAMLNLFDIDTETFAALSTPQLVHLTYFVGNVRGGPKSLLSSIETRLENVIEDLSVSEIGLVCHALFKSSYSICSTTLLQKIGNKVQKDFSELDIYSSVSILKQFRYSGFYQPSFFAALELYLTDEHVEKLNLVAISHYAVTFASFRYWNEKIFNAFVNKFISVASVPRKLVPFSKKVQELHPSVRARCKDIAKLLWAVTSMNHPCEHLNFDAVALDEVQSRVATGEMDWFPHYLIDCLHSLAMRGIFPYDLISLVLSTDYLKKIKAALYEPRRQLFVLDGSIGIECQDYTGNRLPPSFKDQLPAAITGTDGFELKAKVGLTDIMQCLSDLLGGKTFIHCRSIIPHFKTADIIIHVDSAGHPLAVKQGHASKAHQRDLAVPLSDNMLHGLLGRIPAPEKSPAVENRKLAVEVLGQNQCVRDRNVLLGLNRMKMRQLEKLGYKVILIYPFEIQQLENSTHEEREDFLKERLSNYIAF